MNAALTERVLSNLDITFPNREVRQYVVLIGGTRKAPRLRVVTESRWPWDAKAACAHLITDATERVEVRELRCIDPESDGCSGHSFALVDNEGDPSWNSYRECEWCGTAEDDEVEA